jgi:hypothetical protein
MKITFGGAATTVNGQLRIASAIKLGNNLKTAEEYRIAPFSVNWVYNELTQPIVTWAATDAKQITAGHNDAPEHPSSQIRRKMVSS